MPPRTRVPATAGLAAAALLALAGAAQAATPVKSVDMGTPVSAQKSLQKYGADVNAFFPSSISVQVGQKVRFRPVGFHDVDIPAKGGHPVPLMLPTTTISGANDAAGQPFWFNGQTNVGFNPALFAGLYGKSVKYDGRKAVISGLPLAAKPKPFTVSFAKAGTYTYFCDVHPGMKGTIKVVRKGKKAPSVAADKKAVKAQVAAALKTAKQLAATKPPAGTVDVGAAGPHGVESFAFFPSKLTVPAGTTVKFQMTPKSFEIHTATTGPGDPEKQPDSYLGKIAASLQSPAFDPAAVFPSDAPGSVVSLTPTTHGNGFWSSGAMDVTDKTPTIPTSSSVTFGAPGTYEFFCNIHPFMHGTVTVQ